MVGVHCYSSKDLYNWNDEGIAMAVTKDPKSDIVAGSIIERPKVIYNAKTRKFVMWFHLEPKGAGYEGARTGVAVSDNVTGPYAFVRSLRINAGTWPLNFPEVLKKGAVPTVPIPQGSKLWLEANVMGSIVRRDFQGGQMSRDMNLFVDDDGTAYHITASEENGTLHISQLSADYLSFAGRWVRAFVAAHNEAPAVFKRGRKYYMITSGCTGWDPNAARSAVADSMLGEWRALGNPTRGTPAENAYVREPVHLCAAGPGQAGSLHLHGRSLAAEKSDRWPLCLAAGAVGGRQAGVALDEGVVAGGSQIGRGVEAASRGCGEALASPLHAEAAICSPRGLRHC